MSQFPPPPAKPLPLTDAQTRCRRVRAGYVDIIGFASHQLVERQRWCQEQAKRLAPAVVGMPIADVERRLVEDWDLCAAEAAWIVRDLAQKP